QMRELVERLMAAGQWKDGDPEILIVVDAGYDVRDIIARSGSKRATGIGSSPSLVCMVPVAGSMPVATCPSPRAGESMNSSRP
ncbi:transposase, partial [Streptomyces sp. NPDC057543]